MIEAVVNAVNEQVDADGLRRDILENKLIKVLENEGFDSIVDLLWQAVLIACTIGFVDEMREDVLDGVLGSV